MEELVYFVFYSQYGRWHCTLGFQNEVTGPYKRGIDHARAHIRNVLKRPDKDYIKNIQLVEVLFEDDAFVSMTVIPES